MLFLYNEKVFDSSLLAPRSIKKQSRIDWIPVNTQFEQQNYYSVSKTQVFLQDKDIDLDSLTEFEDNSLFQLKNTETRTYEKEYGV